MAASLWPGRAPVALAALAALVLIQVVAIPHTNFGGLDEWLCIDLVGRGIISVPHAHRPLGLLWAVPPLALVPSLGLAPCRWFYGLYLFLTAALTFGIVRRLRPGQPFLAVLTALFLVVWAPSDHSRLSTVDAAVYQGITLGLLLAVALLVEAWHRQNLVLLGCGLLVSFATIRCYEATAPLLAFAPVLLLLTRERSRRLWVWSGLWECVVGLAAAFILLELSVTAGHNAYQVEVAQVDLNPWVWLRQMAWQYRLHVLPLFAPSIGELRRPAVALAVALGVLVLVLFFFMARADGDEWRARRPVLAAGLLGLVLAGLGYSLILVGWHNATAFRLELLSGPGIAVFLASLVQLLASWVRGRERLAATVLAAWVVAVGTARTLALQRDWDAGTFYAKQARMLSGLVQVVPDVVPHTLLVVLDREMAWMGAFSFHHAVQYLFERRAAGFVPDRSDTLYVASVAPEGIRFEPSPILRRAWDAMPTVYGYDEIVVVEYEGAGRVVVLDEWPSALKPLPEGARYAPRLRIVAGPPPGRAALLRR